MADESILSAIDAAVRCLESAGVPYALIGGAAAAAWGRIRSTADADLWIEIDQDSEEGRGILSGLIDALRRSGFAHLERADRRRLGDTTILHFWFPLRPEGLSIRLDLLIGGKGGSEITRRAVERKIDGFSVRVASCEDLILLKIAAGRPVDLADAREIIAINRTVIDLRYLEEKASRMGFAKVLLEILGEEDRT